MSVIWMSGFNPEMIAKEIEDTKKIREDGNIEFEGFGFVQYEIMIHSMLQYLEEIPDIEAKRLSWEAIRNAGKKGKITAKSLISEANRLANSYLNLPVLKFVLSTSISIHNSFSPLPLKETRINEAKIVFQKKLPKRYMQASTEILKQAQRNIIGGYSNNYINAQIYVAARTTHEAANKALDAVDLVRGIWNLHLNQQSPWRMSFGGTRKPVNKLILGPIHILHYPGGKIATPDIWWYEPQYVGPVEPYSFKSTTNLNKFFQKAKVKLNQHKYRDVIKSAIVRYSRALDDRNWNNAFLRLWSILELLTNTGKEGYDVTIKRTSFIFKNRELDLQILRILREYRNTSVHLDQESTEIETYMYQLKYYVEALIRFHLWNKFEFSSLQEAANFLNSPVDEKILQERIQMFKNATKFLGYK